jgi:hypothetical protein
VWQAQGQTTRGGPPRPAEKPPEYGCRLLDLATIPNVVRVGKRIDLFLLKYHCPDKTRPVDIEIRNERTPGEEPKLVKIATRVVLEQGEHTIRLADGGLARGGRYITALMASTPQGKKEVVRRVDPAVCRGWVLDGSGTHSPMGGCRTFLGSDPDPFQTRERIEKFTLRTMCQGEREGMDIRISWEPTGVEHPEARRELVKVATDVKLRKGETNLNLVGGGVGREGTYVLEFGGLGVRHYPTVCTAWTFGGR